MSTSTRTRESVGTRRKSVPVVTQSKKVESSEDKTLAIIPALVPQAGDAIVMVPMNLIMLESWVEAQKSHKGSWRVLKTAKTVDAIQAGAWWIYDKLIAKNIGKKQAMEAMLRISGGKAREAYADLRFGTFPDAMGTKYTHEQAIELVTKMFLVHGGVAHTADDALKTLKHSIKNGTATYAK